MKSYISRKLPEATRMTGQTLDFCNGIVKLAFPASTTVSLILSAFAGPQNALILFRHRREPFVDKLLYALTAVSLRGKHIALRVGRDAVHSVELPGLPSAVAKAREHVERFAIQNAYLLVRPVGEENILLLRIFGKRDVPDRSIAQR